MLTFTFSSISECCCSTWFTCIFYRGRGQVSAKAWKEWDLQKMMDFCRKSAFHMDPVILGRFPTFDAPAAEPYYAQGFQSVMRGISWEFIKIQHFSWKLLNSMKITKFHEIQWFLENPMIFAKRLPLCQHVKIAIIPKGFHGFWSQLLPGIFKKYPGMHFSGFSRKSQKSTYFSGM